jgi:Ca-activated chloride channel family protein
MLQTLMGWLESWFRYPAMLALLGLIPSLWLGQWVRGRRQQLAVLQLTGGHALADVSRPRRRWQHRCRLLAFLLVIVGSAGPQWGRDPQLPAGTGRDVLVLLDVSRSMLAEDRPPAHRLQRARRFLAQLTDTVQRRGGHRLGLIVFAGQAKLACPLTEDYDAFRYAVEQAHPDRLGASGRIGYNADGTSHGTSLRSALRLALDDLDDHSRGFTTLLVVSDGDDLAGDWHAEADRARLQGVPADTLAVGHPTAEAFIPTGRPEQPYLMTEGPAEGSLQRVRTRRNDEVLQRVAERTGGVFRGEESGPAPLEAWFRERVSTQPVRDWVAGQGPLREQQYAGFLAAAAVLWFAGLVVRDRR